MSLFSKFKNNLQKTSNFLSSNILTSFQNKKVDNETLEELETILISADISLDVVEKLLNSVRKVKSSDQDVADHMTEVSAIAEAIRLAEGTLTGDGHSEQEDGDEDGEQLKQEFTFFTRHPDELGGGTKEERHDSFDQGQALGP